MPWVPARPKRLTGRGWPELGAVQGILWRWCWYSLSRHSDAPAAREGGLLLHDGNRALRRAAQLRRAPILTQVRLLHPIVGPHRVEDLVSK